MDRYTLTYEGKAKFTRTKIRMNMEGGGEREGYEVLDYLYEHGAATVAEIENYTGLPYAQVVSKIEAFLSWEYIERLAGQ